LAITKELASRDDATADELYTYAQSFLNGEPPDLRQPLAAVEYAKKAVTKASETAANIWTCWRRRTSKRAMQRTP
jgi:hypothetical protein